MTTREEERREYEIARAALAENERQRAYLTGKIEATIDSLRHDPELVAEVQRIAESRGVDPGVLMDETIENARGKHVPAPSSPGPEPVSGAVRKFRKMLGS